VDRSPSSIHCSEGRKGNSTSALIRIGFADGSHRTIYSAGTYLSQAAVSPDGKRIAYNSADFESDVVELSFSDGAVHTLVGGLSFRPAKQRANLR